MDNYRQNKLKAITYNRDPSLTDQAAARDTDINVIVKQFTVTQQAPGAPVPGIHGDFTNMPTDLREMIETARTLRKHMNRLPPQLRNLGPEQILALTPDRLRAILTPEPKPDASDKQEKTT